MKNKKILALLLAVAMTAGCLAGCGQGTETNKESESSKESEISKESESKTESSTVVEEEPSLYNLGGSLPIVNEPVTLKVLTRDASNNPHIGNEIENSPFWEFFEEKTGIHFEVEAIPEAELKQKMPLIMATPEDMPDIFFNCGLTSAEVLQYGQQGIILCLDEYATEEYMPNFLEMIDTVEGGYGASYAPDGHLYSVPRATYTGSYVQSGMNKTYLDSVGMEAPTTYAELYEVMKAIKAHPDPNADGIQGNEYCISGAYSSFKKTMLQNAGINTYYPWQGCIFDQENDDVYFVPTSQRYKDMLTWLNRFYEEGMIDPEVFTQTSAEYNAKHYANRIFLKTSVDDPEGASYKGVVGDFRLTPLTLYEGETPTMARSGVFTSEAGFVAGNTEYPEICAMVLDAMFAEEISLVAGMGMEGVDYEFVSKEPLILDYYDGHKSSTEALAYGLYAPYWKRKEWQQPQTTALDKVKFEILENYGTLAFQFDLKFTLEEADEMALIEADLGTLCDDYYIGFIIGNYDIEKDWDAYVAECEKMNYKKLEEIYQASYNRFMGND